MMSDSFHSSVSGRFAGAGTGGSSSFRRYTPTPHTATHHRSITDHGEQANLRRNIRALASRQGYTKEQMFAKIGGERREFDRWWSGAGHLEHFHEGHVRDLSQQFGIHETELKGHFDAHNGFDTGI